MQTKVLKSILVLLFILMTVLSHSQSVTEKYNSLYKRYEYFDGSGNLIGYKTYNSLRKQWEYYDSKGSKRKTAFGKYVEPINLELVKSTLQNRQARYNKNRQFISRHFENLREKTFKYFINREKRNRALEIVSVVIQEEIKKNIDYSNSDLVNNLVDYLNKAYYWTIEQVENEFSSNDYSFEQSNKHDNEFKKKENKIARSNKALPPNTSLGRYKLKKNVEEANLKKEDNVFSDIIYKVKSNDVILLLEENKSKSNIYNKVWVNGYYGYLMEDLINKSS